jgi:hypothetical protein
VTAAELLDIASRGKAGRQGPGRGRAFGQDARWRRPGGAAPEALTGPGRQAKWRSRIPGHAGLLPDDNRQAVELGDVAVERGPVRGTAIVPGEVG